MQHPHDPILNFTTFITFKSISDDNSPLRRTFSTEFLMILDIIALLMVKIHLDKTFNGLSRTIHHNLLSNHMFQWDLCL